MSWTPAQEPDRQSEGCPQAIETIVRPRTHDIGGFEVRRALPSGLRSAVGPFVFFDQMGPGAFASGKGVDVRPHPHIGLATITYLFSGSIDHADSLGYHETIYPGDINLMIAGSGIVHSERTGPEVRKNPSDLFGLQSWIALPKDKEEQASRFQQYKKENLPFINEDDRKMRVISGRYEGLASPVDMPAPTLYLDVWLSAGETLKIPADYEERALYVLSGEIEIAGAAYPPAQLLVLRPGVVVDLQARQETRLVVIGGDALDGPRYLWWNFVSSRKERIEQAKEDWKNKKFGSVAGDPEFIPLPDK
jgi:redox-sensitive bicupin YhaK (pirin superfamily)